MKNIFIKFLLIFAFILGLNTPSFAGDLGINSVIYDNSSSFVVINSSDSDDYSFEEELNKYFDFIYSPYNDFLKKINGFSMIDVSSVITDKYRLLGINVTNDNISVDNLDSFMDSVNYVKFIDDILKGDLSFDDINVIVKFREFEPIELPDDDEII